MARRKTVDKVLEDIGQVSVDDTKNKKTINPYEPFLFRGETLDELKSVYEERDHKKQLRLVNARCKAMFNYCLRNDLIMTDAHIALVLGIEKKTLKKWVEGKQLGTERGKSRYDNVAHYDDLQFVKDRAELLRKWQTMAEMRSCDKISRDKNPQGAVYLTKANFGLYDAPRETEKGPGIHVENLILRSEQLRKAGLIRPESTNEAPASAENG